MADVASGEALYNKYSEVSEEDGGWLSLRDTVLARKMPRRMLVQPLTVIQGTETSHKLNSTGPIIFMNYYCYSQSQFCKFNCLLNYYSFDC